MLNLDKPTIVVMPGMDKLRIVPDLSLRYPGPLPEPIQFLQDTLHLDPVELCGRGITEGTTLAESQRIFASLIAGFGLADLQNLIQRNLNIVGCFGHSQGEVVLSLLQMVGLEATMKLNQIRAEAMARTSNLGFLSLFLSRQMLEPDQVESIYSLCNDSGPYKALNNGSAIGIAVDKAMQEVLDAAKRTFSGFAKLLKTDLIPSHSPFQLEAEATFVSALNAFVNPIIDSIKLSGPKIYLSNNTIPATPAEVITHLSHMTSTFFDFSNLVESVGDDAEQIVVVGLVRETVANFIRVINPKLNVITDF